MQRFGEKLRILRKQHGLTQIKLAKQIGLAWSYIGELESGKYDNPSARLVIKIADFFGVPIDVLVRDELDLDNNDEPS